MRLTMLTMHLTQEKGAKDRDGFKQNLGPLSLFETIYEVIRKWSVTTSRRDTRASTGCAWNKTRGIVGREDAPYYDRPNTNEIDLFYQAKDR